MADRMSHELGDLLNELAASGSRLVEAREALSTVQRGPRPNEKKADFIVRKRTAEEVFKAAVQRRIKLREQVRVLAEIEGILGIQGVPVQDRNPSEPA